MSTDNNSKGILLIIAAMTLFAMQDSLIKFIFEKAALYEIFFGRYFVAAILLSISSVVGEGSTFSISNPDISLFGWLLNSKWAILVFYLAIGPGLIGHTGLNGVLKWVSPLLVSSCLVMEPLIGSIIGYYFVSTEITVFETIFGGVIMIIGTLMVTISQHKTTVQEGG